MEQQFSNEPLLDLQVDYDSGNKFNEASRWAKFFAIVCFVGIGLMLLWVIIAGAAASDAFSKFMPGTEFYMEGMGALVIGIIIIVLGIFGFLMFLLYRFATLVKQGIQMQDQSLFNEGLRNLKNYFLINGIFALIGIVINALGLLGKIF